MAGGDGMSGTGISTVPSPSVVAVGGCGGGVDVGATLVSSAVVSDVVVVVVVSSSAESLLQPVISAATAAPEANTSRTGVDTP